MPVRSLRSSVLAWPDRPSVDSAARAWAIAQSKCRRDVVRIGYFGSYARDDWGVGSDLDVVVVLRSSREPFERRAAGWDTESLPVPVDLLVYTESEWQRLLADGGRFGRTLTRETLWVYPAD